MTFTEKQQAAHRKTFIEECQHKAWGARCHAEWISKQLDDLVAQFQKLQ
jgi:predicted  nucleic acid-binding Zn-ribbon protein